MDSALFPVEILYESQSKGNELVIPRDERLFQVWSLQLRCALKFEHTLQHLMTSRMSFEIGKN